MTIITEYNNNELTDEQLEALAASFLSQIIEYYNITVDVKSKSDDNKAA